MQRMDELHLKHPFYGARQLAKKLRKEGFKAGRRRRRSADASLGIEARYCKPRTSLPPRQAAIYPYLPIGLAIGRPNQVWSSDITYLPMARTAFCTWRRSLDVASRKVLAFRLSNTLTADFCVAALEEALLKFGTPEIFNTDQGAQFTSEPWLNTLKAGPDTSA